MKLGLLAFLLGMASCQKGTDTSEKLTLEAEELVLGGDRDEKGCIGSAGYTWSTVKDTCIRIFEEGTPFIQYEMTTGATDSSIVAYVVLSADRQQAEAFFGTTDKPIVMDAIPVMEGETMPVWFENKTERIKLRSYRDVYQLLYLDTVRYVQYNDFEKGMWKWFKK